MAHWRIADIPWERFDRAKVDPELLQIVKAASLVEFDGEDYARYLCRIFHDDPSFQEVARSWGAEEMQHGEALARWAALADPSFDFSLRSPDSRKASTASSPGRPRSEAHGQAR